MNDAGRLIKKYLNQVSTMQLGTVAGDQPWVCTVRFVTDDDNAIYWASLPSRRHSQEISNHAKVSCAIVVQDKLDKPVIGIQIEGNAEMLPVPLSDETIVNRYAEAFGRDQQWVDDFINGRTEHRLYKLQPTAIYIIDEENLPKSQRHRAELV